MHCYCVKEKAVAKQMEKIKSFQTNFKVLQNTGTTGEVKESIQEFSALWTRPLLKLTQ